MTEKRFTVVYDDIIDLGSIYDSQTEKFYSVGTVSRTELMCNLLNELSEENELFKDKVYSVIDKRINALENDYNRAVKGGMPSMGVYSEIILLDELKKELSE